MPSGPLKAPRQAGRIQKLPLVFFFSFKYPKWDQNDWVRMGREPSILTPNCTIEWPVYDVTPKYVSMFLSEIVG